MKNFNIDLRLGAEDLKGQVEKYKDELTTTGKLSELDLLTIHILVEQAMNDLRCHKPAFALTYVEKALRLDPSSIEVLELKGQCFSQMNMHLEALEAADKILIELRECHNSKSLAVKAGALYNLGDFEHALLCFHKAIRGATIREQEELRHSIKRTELAVLNAVGPQVSYYFKNLDSILSSIPGNILGMPWYKIKNFVSVKDSKAGARTKDRKFLSELASDKHYLEGVVSTLGRSKGAAHSTTREIVSEVS